MHAAEQVAKGAEQTTSNILHGLVDPVVGRLRAELGPHRPRNTPLPYTPVPDTPALANAPGKARNVPLAYKGLLTGMATRV